MKDGVFLAPSNLLKLKMALHIPIPTVPETHVIPPIAFSTSDNGQIAIMDKKLAHGLLEIMLIEVSEREKRTINQLSEEEATLYTELVELFLCFINEEDIKKEFNLHNTVSRIVFNYDPWTEDRDGLQPVKRFHTHLYIVDDHVINQLNKNTVVYEDLQSRYERRKLVDPFSFIGTSILFDIHQNLLNKKDLNIKIMNVDPVEAIEQGLPLGLNIKLRKNRNGTVNKKLKEYILKINELIENSFIDIYKAVTGSIPPAQKYKRHDLLDTEIAMENLSQISWLSERSMKGLYEVVTTLNSESYKLFQRKKHLDLLLFHNLLNGLAYTFSINMNIGEPHSEIDILDINISVRLFGDSGGAGMFGLKEKSIVLFNRGEGIYNKEQLARRHQFQRRFQKYVIEKLKLQYTYNTIEAVKANRLLNKYYNNKIKESQGITEKILLEIIDYHRNK
ncbi:hypothetical protein [Paenibacillus wenxiniae]|uniref:Uncharacterized protein n=1 Tax=Paenibacillus wenxiniae TaxID=1636843 RepID=A0ABW4RMK9_9BACL